MHSFAQFLTEGAKGRTQAFVAAVTMDCELSLTPSPGHDMRETQKIECFGTSALSGFQFRVGIAIDRSVVALFQ